MPNVRHMRLFFLYMQAAVETSGIQMWGFSTPARQGVALGGQVIPAEPGGVGVWETGFEVERDLLCIASA